MLAQETFVHECLLVFCSLPCSSTFDLQNIWTFFGLGSHLFSCLAIAALGNLVEHIVDENSALVLDHAAPHFHRKNFHGFSM